MRLSYTNHAISRANQRGCPVYRRLPKSARLTCTHPFPETGPHKDLLVSEYEIPRRRDVPVLVKRGEGFQQEGRTQRRYSVLVLVVTPDGCVITIFWKREEDMRGGDWGKGAAQRKRMLQEARERDEIACQTEIDLLLADAEDIL